MKKSIDWNDPIVKQLCGEEYRYQCKIIRAGRILGNRGLSKRRRKMWKRVYERNLHLDDEMIIRIKAGRPVDVHIKYQ